MSTPLIRLQKYIADSGVTSRRKAEQLILAGRVKLNGNTVTELGTKVDCEEDVVMVNGEIINRDAVDHLYLVLNKPRAYMTTVSDPEGRPTVMDLTDRIKKRIYPVGRLDYLSEGLLLMTNDGEIANKIMHPKYEVEKVYEVKVFGKVNEILLNKLRKGVAAEDGLLKPKSVRVIEQLPNKTWLEFRLVEGKNREIRRICEAVEVTIDKLRRVAIGALSIQGIQPGEWRFITKKELLQALGMTPDGGKFINRTYLSKKKTVDLKKKFRMGATGKLADSKEFGSFKKESYYETLKKQQEIKESIAQGLIQKAKMESEKSAPKKTSYRSR
jgi:23S rRNA pseudouridine2605 synthase